MNWTIEELEKVKLAINEKARIDMEFRLLCLADPRNAVETISGKAVPEGLNIRFIENEGAHLTHVLPDFISPSGEELSDEELEQVSAAGNKEEQGDPVIVSPRLTCPQCGAHQIVVSSFQYKCINCGYSGDFYSFSPGL